MKNSGALFLHYQLVKLINPDKKNLLPAALKGFFERRFFDDFIRFKR
jgi:hypothetical protein